MGSAINHSNAPTIICQFFHSLAMDMAENTENSPPAYILPLISHIGKIPLKYCHNSSGNLMNVTHFSDFIELSRKYHLIRSDLMRKLSLKAEMVNLCQFEVVMSVSTCIAWHPKMQAQPMHRKTQSVVKRIIKYACDWCSRNSNVFGIDQCRFS